MEDLLCASPDTDSALTLFLDFPGHRAMRNTCYLQAIHFLAFLLQQLKWTKTLGMVRVGSLPPLLPMTSPPAADVLNVTLWLHWLGWQMPAVALPATLTSVLTLEPSSGGSLGNWFHPSLILSGAKGKVINIFIYNSRRIKI